MKGLRMTTSVGRLSLAALALVPLLLAACGDDLAQSCPEERTTVRMALALVRLAHLTEALEPCDRFLRDTCPATGPSRSFGSTWGPCSCPRRPASGGGPGGLRAAGGRAGTAGAAPTRRAGGRRAAGRGPDEGVGAAGVGGLDADGGAASAVRVLLGQEAPEAFGERLGSWVDAATASAAMAALSSQREHGDLCRQGAGASAGGDGLTGRPAARLHRCAISSSDRRVITVSGWSSPSTRQRASRTSWRAISASAVRPWPAVTRARS